VRSYKVPPSQNPLMKEKRAYEIAVGIKAAPTGNAIALYKFTFSY